jgi:hypothetical protein
MFREIMPVAIFSGFVIFHWFLELVPNLAKNESVLHRSFWDIPFTWKNEILNSWKTFKNFFALW